MRVVFLSLPVPGHIEASYGLALAKAFHKKELCNVFGKRHKRKGDQI